MRPDRKELSWMLMDAIVGGKGLGLVQTLVQAGADVNYVDPDGNPLLALALANEADDVALYLIDKGANPDVKNRQGSPLLLLVDSDVVARRMVEAGADVNVRDSQGWTPLLEAVYTGKAEVAAFFIEAGADISVRHPDNGKSIFEEARDAGDYTTLRAISEAVQQVAETNRQRETAAIVKTIANDLGSKRTIRSMPRVPFRKKGPQP